MKVEVVTLTKGELKSLLAEAVAMGIEQVRVELLKGACEYLDEKEAAARIGVEVRKLKEWRRSGLGPAYIERDGILRYSKADLAAYMAAGRVSSDF